MRRMDDAFQAPGSETDQDAIHDLRSRARTANTLGLISVILCLVAPCSSCMTLLGALPMSLITVHYSRTVLADEPDEVAAAYARTGMATGVISLIYSVIMLLVVVAYFGLYFGIIGLAVLGNL